MKKTNGSKAAPGAINMHCEENTEALISFRDLSAKNTETVVTLSATNVRMAVNQRRLRR